MANKQSQSHQTHSHGPWGLQNIWGPAWGPGELPDDPTVDTFPHPFWRHHLGSLPCRIRKPLRIALVGAGLDAPGHAFRELGIPVKAFRWDTNPKENDF